MINAALLISTKICVALDLMKVVHPWSICTLLAAAAVVPSLIL